MTTVEHTDVERKIIKSYDTLDTHTYVRYSNLLQAKHSIACGTRSMRTRHFNTHA
jgi:hypothetical protein